MSKFGFLKNIVSNSKVGLGIPLIVSGIIVVAVSQATRSLGLPLIEELIRTSQVVDGMTIDPALEAQPVIVTANLSSEETLEDEYLKAGKYLALTRYVEMYQWQEEDASENEKRYFLGWFPEQVDFLSFAQPKGHENPAFLIEEKQIHVNAARFGAYDAKTVVRSLSGKHSLPLDANMLKDPTAEISGNYIYFRKSKNQIGDGVGDVRISYRAVLPGKYTVIGVQHNDALVIGKSESGEVYFFAYPGELSARELLTIDREKQVQSTGRFRLFGLGILFLGMLTATAPIKKKVTVGSIEFPAFVARTLVSLIASLVITGIVMGMAG